MYTYYRPCEIVYCFVFCCVIYHVIVFDQSEEIEDDDEEDEEEPEQGFAQLVDKGQSTNVATTDWPGNVLCTFCCYAQILSMTTGWKIQM